MWKKAVATTGANPQGPRTTRPRAKTTRAGPREGGPGRAKILAPLSCALTIGALLDTSKYKKVSCSEPLGVTIFKLLPGYVAIS